MDAVHNVPYMNAAKQILVIGSGMAGLSAAVSLRRKAFDVTVVEAQDRLGGRVNSVEVEGTHVDLGAQFIASFSSDLLKELRSSGLPADSLSVRQQHTTVAKDRRLWPISSPKDLLTSGLLSFRSRAALPGLIAPVLRAWSDLDPIDLAAGHQFDDDTAANLLRRWRLGGDVAENFVGPIIQGLLYWDLDTTSQAVLLAMLKASVGDSSVHRCPLGMSEIVDVLAKDLKVRLSTEATRLSRLEDGRFAVECRSRNETSSLEVDGVVVATTAPAAGRVTRDLPGSDVGFLRSVSYSSTRVFVFRAPDDVAGPGSSIMFPTRRGQLLASVNPVAEAGGSGTRFRVQLSSSGVAHFEGLNEDEDASHRVLELVERECGPLPWTRGSTLICAREWGEALPEFGVGYLRAKGLREPRSLGPAGVEFAGDYLMAPHLAGANRSGVEAAGRLSAHLC